MEHVVEMHLNRQRVFADQAQVGQTRAFKAGDHLARQSAAAMTLAIAADARIGLHLDQRAALFELQGLNRGDLGLPLARCCQCVITGNSIFSIGQVFLWHSFL
jgi:hypothetical protein